ncbi:hypothetical protein [Clostridium lacusfryxellense]|uniref:hypothetical protein n=1 Tax=Clostridium lacusfryxellense TaxID=205328 RepID=UPI001C0BF010|nr:hypothetical protein [Clostridium lacusfryxellense]MBU3114626.1 hypothetical protein [Clostridium lacusfryxellense]
MNPGGYIPIIPEETDADIMNLQVFNNPEFGDIRWIKIDDKDYAVGIDKAKALGYKDVNSALSRHCNGWVKHPPMGNNWNKDRWNRVYSNCRYECSI